MVLPVDLKITVALISAAGALAVALIQVFAQKKNAQAIENLKSLLERRRVEHAEYLKAYMGLVIDGREQQLQASKAILQKVQLLRDKLRAVTADPTAFDRPRLYQELKELVDGVTHAFAEHQTALTDEGRSLAHRLKNECLALRQRLARLAIEGGSRVHNDDLREIMMIEDDLRNLQSAFREQALRANAAIVESLAQEIGAK
jgi:hypothetical protein